MKKIFTFLTVAIFTMSLSAQHGSSFTYQFNNASDNYLDDNGYHNTSDDYDYGDSGRYNDDYYRNDRLERYDRGGNDYDRRQRYKRKRYQVRFENLSYRDQKRILKLERKYVRTEKRAWGNGYINRHERKNLKGIQRDIDNVWARYERNRNDRYGNYGSCG